LALNVFTEIYYLCKNEVFYIHIKSLHIGAFIGALWGY